MIYATLQDLMDGWRYLTVQEQHIAETLLSRASDLLSFELRKHDKDTSKLTALELSVCKTIVCDTVRYSFVSGSFGGSPYIGDGIDTTIMPGDMQGGSLQITTLQRKQLGIASRAGFMGFCD